MTDRPCHTCRWHALHTVGEPFKLDRLCYHPDQAWIGKMSGTRRSVSCKVMRKGEKDWQLCGPDGRLWEPKPTKNSVSALLAAKSDRVGMVMPSMRTALYGLARRLWRGLR